MAHKLLIFLEIGSGRNQSLPCDLIGCSREEIQAFSANLLAAAEGGILRDLRMVRNPIAKLYARPKVCMFCFSKKMFASFSIGNLAKSSGTMIIAMKVIFISPKNWEIMQHNDDNAENVLSRVSPECYFE